MEPLMLEICMRADSQVMYHVGQTLVTSLDKQYPEQASRSRQSQCAQFLCRFLERASSSGTNSVTWAAAEGDVAEICDQVVEYVIKQIRGAEGSAERYNQQQPRNVVGMKRHAQLLVLFGMHPGIMKLLQVGLVPHL